MVHMYVPTPYALSLNNQNIINYNVYKCSKGYCMGESIDIIGCPVIQFIILATELYRTNKQYLTKESLIEYIKNSTDIIINWLIDGPIIWAPYCGSKQKCEIHYETFINDIFALINYTIPSENLNTKLYGNILDNPIYFIKIN